MLTTIPLLAAVFALVTGAAAAAGVKRVLALVREFPAGTYRLVIGMHPAVQAILEERGRKPSRGQRLARTVAIPTTLAAVWAHSRRRS